MRKARTARDDIGENALFDASPQRSGRRSVSLGSHEILTPTADLCEAARRVEHAPLVRRVPVIAGELG